MNILNRIPAITRKGKIEETMGEMEILQEMLFHALMTKGPLTKHQRVTVLKRLVDQVKNHSENELMEDNKKIVESENLLDVIKGIMLFNL